MNITIFTNRASLILSALALILCLSPLSAQAVPLHNDYGNSFLERAHLDATTSHYEYGEALERGKIKRELVNEINELSDVDKDILKQKLKTANHHHEDTNSRTNFFSNDDHHDHSYQIDVFSGADDFYYFHQLPPSVNPDVSSSPYFNDFDFRTSLIEFEFFLEGWTTNNPGDSSFEVRIMNGETFGTDSSNRTILTTVGSDIGTLGALTFGGREHDGIYRFDFSFEQFGPDDSLGTFISPEIYQAISDGILGIHIARTSGSGNLFLEDSEAIFEQVPEPATILLLGSGLLGLGWFGRQRSKHIKG
ncbi:MAG: PEP-CTERM sorting domain-containing protein [Thermodesulfobacteriota bacterium]